MQSPKPYLYISNNDIKIQLSFLSHLVEENIFTKIIFLNFRDIVVVEEEDETADYEEDVKTKDLVSFWHDEDQSAITFYLRCI